MVHDVNQLPYCFDCAHLTCKALQEARTIFLIEFDLWTQQLACVDIHCQRCGTLLLSADGQLDLRCDDAELIN